MFFILNHLGRSVTGWIRVIFEFMDLMFRTIYWTFVGPFRKKPINIKTTVDQMIYMGLNSIIIVFFVTYFTGVVLAMQSAPQLDKMGGLFYVAGLVTVSICRELGPVLTALVLAGRIGAAITAEIGSMKVNEQIEALDTMAIDPVRYLVVPKLVSLLIMLPCLTVIGDFSGIFGGYSIGVYNLKINPGLYWQTATKFLDLQDIYTGLLKSVVFAFIIVLIGAYQGFKTRGGAVGVGQATTTSVVTSFIFIIIADAILTSIFFFSEL